jgi:large subunit ribosomal protein L29
MKNSFKELSFKELVQKREEVKKAFFDLRFKMVVGHVDNPMQKKELKRQIARLNTIIYNHPDVSGTQGQE